MDNTNSLLLNKIFSSFLKTVSIKVWAQRFQKTVKNDRTIHISEDVS